MLGAIGSAVKCGTHASGVPKAALQRSAHRSLQLPRKPVHDVERQLSIVDPGTVHAELHLLRAGTYNPRETFAPFDINGICRP